MAQDRCLLEPDASEPQESKKSGASQCQEPCGDGQDQGGVDGEPDVKDFRGF